MATNPTDTTADLDQVDAPDSTTFETSASADEAAFDGEDFYADTDGSEISTPVRKGRWKVRLAVAALVIAAAVAGAGVSAALLSEESAALLKEYGELQGEYEVLTEDYLSLSDDVEALKGKVAGLSELVQVSKGKAKKEG